MSLKIALRCAAISLLLLACDEEKGTVAVVLEDTLATDLVVTAGQKLIIRDNVLVPEGVTLRIEAGAMVQFDSQAYLLVEGNFHVDGTASNPVRFDCVAGGQGYSIRVDGQYGGEHGLDHVHFTGAENALWLTTTRPELEGCRFTDCQYGLKISSTQGGELGNLVFRNCTTMALDVDNAVDLVVHDCRFIGNSQAVDEPCYVLNGSRVHHQNVQFDGEAYCLELSDHDHSVFEDVAFRNALRGVRYYGVSQTAFLGAEFRDVERALQVYEWKRDSLDFQRLNFIDCDLVMEYLEGGLRYSQNRGIPFPGHYYERGGFMLDSTAIAAAVIDEIDLRTGFDSLLFMPAALTPWPIDAP